MDYSKSWCERYGRTEQELFDAAGLFFQVANLVYAASRERVLERKFEYLFNAENSQVVRDKVKRNLDKRISGCLKFGADDSLSLLHDAVFQLGFTKKPNSKGLCRKLSLPEYLLLNDFHYFIAQNLFNNPFQHDPFELRNAVWDLIQYLFLVDTLENGFDKESMNRVAHQLMSSQQKQFFANGHPLDFFVHDREFSSRHKQTAIACYRDRISTCIFSGLDALRQAQRDAMECKKLVFTFV